MLAVTECLCLKLMRPPAPGFILSGTSPNALFYLAGAERSYQWKASKERPDDHSNDRRALLHSTSAAFA